MNASADNEHNTNVPDREERKNIRRKRVEKRNATDDTSGNQAADGDQGTHKTGQHQVSESLFHLEKRKLTGIEKVTEVRLKTDESEGKRRVEDEKMRHERLAKLQHEALASAKANAAIEMKWAELLEKEIPQELHHDIQSQMAACSGIIKSKDGLIAEFLMQLRSKDEEYVRALRQQSEDIEKLLESIRSEYKAMQTQYDQELDAIEDAYLEERDRIISDHTTEVDTLFESRRNREVFYKETKQKREEQYQKEIEDLITRGADQYNKLKIELEMNIQTLKQQLEEIRATYQLNTEKLDYNYRVLTELDVEKNAELTRYKRRLTRLKDHLNHFVSRYNEMNALDSKTNNELTEDYRRLTQKYKDLQAKFRHFEVADTQKYSEVWAMHEDEAKDLVDKLLKADKVITEQQLGWVWRPPDLQSFNRNRDDGATAAGTADDTHEETASQTGKSPNKKAKNTVSGTRIRSVLKLLADEAGFLLQPEVQQSLEQLPAQEANLARAEAMLRALGVKNEDKVVQLMKYFFRDSTEGCLVDAGNEMISINPNEEVDEDALLDAQDAELKLHFPAEDLDELRELISAESVIAAVAAFMDDTHVDTLGPNGMKTKSTEDGVLGGTVKANSAHAYWIQLSQIVPDVSVDVWRQLEKDVMNYKELLERRSASINEVDALQAQNVELKRLLNQYLGDSRNELFCIPPSQTMRVEKRVPVSSKKGGGKVLMSKTR